MPAVDTETEPLEPNPLSQEYVPPPGVPEAVSVPEVPVQISKLVGEMATVGIVTTVTSINSIVWQPSAVSVIIS